MAAPTTIEIDSDDSEYSRFESDRSVVGFTVQVTGASLSGEEITVELMKGRRARDVAVAYLTLTLDQAGDATYTGQFDLTRIVDTEEVSKVRRGDYFLRATSVTDEDITADSSDFRLSLITVDRLKNDYLYGADLKSTEILGPHDQPVVITGVTITEVSNGHAQEWITLSYNITTVSAGVFVRTLSWCGGPQVTIVAGTRNYTLRRGTSNDWIRVKVSSVLDLPPSTVSEDILITTKSFDDVRFRNIIDQAISWIEDVELFVFLEPTLVTTVPTEGTTPDDTDVPVFAGADWDEVVSAVSYHAPSAGSWINFKLPYKPVIRFNELYGIVSTARVIDMNLDWIKAHEKTGFVELMPFSQSTAFSFLGLAWVQAIRGNITLPSFWNYEALCGFRETPPVLLEVVAKKAAMDILNVAGMAKRPGVASQSTSRDGVSSSISYTASATTGTYSAIINEYKDFIESSIKHLKGAFSGLRMVVV